MNATHAILVLAVARTLLHSPMAAAGEMLQSPPNIAACVQSLVDSKMEADLRKAVQSENIDSGLPSIPEAGIVIVQETLHPDASARSGSSAL